MTGLSLATIGSWIGQWRESAKLRNGQFKVVVQSDGERHVLYGSQEQIAKELKKLGEFLEKNA